MRRQSPRRLPIAVTLLAGVFALAALGSPAPAELPKGLVQEKPKEGRSVKTDRGYMVPYEAKIPGTEVTYQMVPIPGGTFEMGSEEGDHPRRQPSEGPAFKVKVPPMWIGKYEVTWDQFDKFLFLYEKGKSPNEVPDEKKADAVSLPTPQYEQDAIPIINRMGREGGYPAADMTQLSARQYTKWLSKKTGRFYRLPTEAEWEYACRAGTQTSWYFGDNPDKLPSHAWFIDNSFTDRSPDGQYHKVGQKKPNPWGLYDMHGNVAEYVIDQYKKGHYKKMAAKEQPVSRDEAIAWPSSDEQYKRIVRGGGYISFPDETRSAVRAWSKRQWKKQDPQIPLSIWHHTESFWVGYRIARPLKAPSAERKMKFWQPEAKYVRELMNSEGADSKQAKLLLEGTGKDQ